MSGEGLTVAVTGPTGEIGAPFMDALERTPEVARVVAMARRPFDPADRGWTKAEYRQGDILDREAVESLVAGADAVVHLAFIVVKATADSYDINVEGSRNVFEATVAAGAPRLVYTSSVAAYGYHRDDDGPLREDMPPRGTEAHAYSHQKAAVEVALAAALDGRDATAAYVFRPCVVAGPQAPALIDQLPYLRLEQRLPDALLRGLAKVPGAKPVLPDHGIPFQLVHHDDVADALVAAVLGRGEPGIYNLAADGALTLSELAAALGWHSVPVPKATVDVAAEVLGRLPVMEVEAGWLEAARTSMAMDTTRAREQLGWTPAYDSRETLESLVAARRRQAE
ncbi:MAG: NAD-dependent epimerase/dehydratase family protein [Thermoleophilaceae bacterium]